MEKKKIVTVGHNLPIRAISLGIIIWLSAKSDNYVHHNPWVGHAFNNWVAWALLAGLAVAIGVTAWAFLYTDEKSSPYRVASFGTVCVFGTLFYSHVFRAHFGLFILVVALVVLLLIGSLNASYPED